MNTLTDLERVFDTAYIYIGVAVKLPNLEQPEIIINTIENYAEKLKYYKNAYNNDLTLKTCKDIQIVGAYASDYPEDIVELLEVYFD
jgi:hypothetical protein